ncbi:MAG: restriction endonuclease [Caulobacteraceae bacterium]|nr:restriction endonuclease [Caulobacteraceae bacterium]
MAIPDYQSAMLPLLNRVAEAKEPASIMELMPALAADFGLSEEEMAERLPSGMQGVFHNRLHWAKFYMTRAGLLETTRRGRFQITPEGSALLRTGLTQITNQTLSASPAFKAWFKSSQASPTNTSITEPAVDASGATPEERIEEARKELEANLKAEILDRVRQMLPADFEQLIIQLLVRMNYGQGREELAKALGGSGDGGVDGVVHQDPLGLDRVYIQAKRYKEGNNVGPEAINSFIGALNIKKANKGLFVTASSFSKQAREHAMASSLHVVLIDGDRLAELMIRHGVGVLTRHMVEIKTLDEGFFEG